MITEYKQHTNVFCPCKQHIQNPIRFIENTARLIKKHAANTFCTLMLNYINVLIMPYTLKSIIG